MRILILLSTAWITIHPGPLVIHDRETWKVEPCIKWDFSSYVQSSLAFIKCRYDVIKKKVDKSEYSEAAVIRRGSSSRKFIRDDSRFLGYNWRWRLGGLVFLYLRASLPRVYNYTHCSINPQPVVEWFISQSIPPYVWSKRCQTLVGLSCLLYNSLVSTLSMAQSSCL